MYVPVYDVPYLYLYLVLTPLNERISHPLFYRRLQLYYLYLEPDYRSYYYIVSLITGTCVPPINSSTTRLRCFAMWPHKCTTCTAKLLFYHLLASYSYWSHVFPSNAYCRLLDLYGFLGLRSHQRPSSEKCCVRCGSNHYSPNLACCVPWRWRP